MQSYKIIIIISIFLTLLIISLYINFFVIPQKTETEKFSIPVSEHKSIKKQENQVLKKNDWTSSESLTLPLLNDSDTFVREYLKKCSNHLEFNLWLKCNDIIRRFVATVDNIANGENPSANLKFLEPKEEFQIIQKNNQIALNPESYTRFNTMVNIFCSIKNENLIFLYQQFKPLVNQAYAEMGYPEKKFEDTLIQAFRIILTTPVIAYPIYLEKKVVSYAFKDPIIEALNPAQKQLLRTGPENILKIQQKLQEIKNLLRFQAKED